MVFYKLAVAQYHIPGRPRGEEHWALVATLPGSAPAHCFHIIGNTDTFAFQYKYTSNILKSSLLRGGAVVGEIPEEHIAWVKAQLENAVKIRRNDPTFHCQEWVLEAIDELKEWNETGKVRIYRPFVRSELRRRLAEDYARFEQRHPDCFRRLQAGQAA